MMLIDTSTIPGTGLRRNSNHEAVDSGLKSSIGEVTNHIVLADYIVFTTDLNKVFCYPFTSFKPAQETRNPIELTTFYSALPSQVFESRGLQGSYTHFAIYTKDGHALVGSQDLLRSFCDAQNESLLDDPMALQLPSSIHSHQTLPVISMAFGDHHSHALHSNGLITSYGEEPQGCGALGLGCKSAPASILRGVIHSINRVGGIASNRLPDGEGRTVWFEPLMATWLEDMYRKWRTACESKERGNTLRVGHEGTRKAFADYFEKEGARWEEGITKEGEMGAYFALRVASGGWSSAALVLVDEDKAERAREAHIVRPLAERTPPSPAISAQSGASNETIESPGEQLTNEIYAIYTWLWTFGRWFLGLTARDAGREAQEKAKFEGRGDDHVEYTWDKDPFLRLSSPNGEVMPAEIPLIDDQG